MTVDADYLVTQGTWQFMSVGALNNHSKAIVVQDELESFFHVSLNIALRLLPHNCIDSAVPRLLHDYFDDYAPNEKEHRCGLTKKCAMFLGRIELSAYNPNENGMAVDDLRFIWPGKNPKNRPYPLQVLYTTLLSWFSAHYALRAPKSLEAMALDEDEEDSDEEPDLLTGSGTTSGFLTKLLSVAEDSGDELEPSDGTPPPSPQTDGSPFIAGLPPSATTLRRSGKPLSREDLEKLAKNLETHEPMMRELAKTLKMKWPPIDRCKDRKPDNWVDSKDPVPLGSKRNSSAVDEGQSNGRPSKRPKA